MKRSFIIIIVVFLCFGVSWDLWAKDPTVDEIINKVQARLNNAELITIEFTQTFYWSMTDETQRYSGQIFIGKGDAFRIETLEQLLVSDGKSVWTLDKANQQVIIDRLDKSQEDYLPRQLFFHFQRDYHAQLEGTQDIGGKSCYHLLLQPKNEDVYVKKLDAWIDKGEWLTRQVSYLDVNDNTTTYLIKSYQFASKSDPALFQYAVPPGIEVIDLREN